MRWWSRGVTFVSLSYLPRISFRLEIETSARLLNPPPYVFSEFPSKCGKMGSSLNISRASSSAAVAEAPPPSAPGREESEPTDVSKQVPRTALEQKDVCTFVCVHVCVCSTTVDGQLCRTESVSSCDELTLAPPIAALCPLIPVHYLDCTAVIRQPGRW